MFGVAHRHQGMDLLNQLLLLVIVKVHVPFGKARLSSAILDQNEANLEGRLVNQMVRAMADMLLTMVVCVCLCWRGETRR